jgi:chemotaxis methyl-accepting protein methylase
MRANVYAITAISARSRGSLVAIDPAERALEEARLRCAPHRNIAFATMQTPGEWPAGTFDLIVLSEVLYFFDRPLIRQLAERIEGSLRNPSHVLLVHWLGETDYPLRETTQSRNSWRAPVRFYELFVNNG